MEVHYPRTAWKNSYAEHKVTGKTYNQKIFIHGDMFCEKNNGMKNPYLEPELNIRPIYPYMGIAMVYCISGCYA